MSKAHEAACQLKDLFDTRPTIERQKATGHRVDKIEGSIDFQDVFFSYPARPQVPVLRGLTFSVKPKQFVALVGPSGCGKSTVLSLLQRFYDTNSGTICINGTDMKAMDVCSYRQQLALVSQEPTLYQGTILDNIRLGVSGEPSMDDIVSACQQANIHDFIMSLPGGYSTSVGSRGVLLSGGQKQRLAIARALVRQAKILLLDEATSALDSSSERLVQAALDVAARGCTTIAVAHRLSTIRHADTIYVLEQGKIAEQGTHDQLMATGGLYAELVLSQNLEE